MELVMLERRCTPPIQLDGVRAMEQQSTWCMEQYRVQHVTSLLSHDGARLTCSFAAPDVESLRSVLRQLDMPFERIWRASVHAAPGERVAAPLAVPEPALVVVERRFAEPVELAALQETEDRAAWCLTQHRVRFLRTYFALDRRCMICVYAAPDAESVRSAQRQAGMPFDTVWAALAYDSAR